MATKSLITVLLIGLSGCWQRNSKIETHKSSSGKYTLKVEVNEDKQDKTKWKCLRFRLFDVGDKELDNIQTGASDFMKWSVSWYSDDVIILNSRDIGVYAWMVNDEKKFQSVLVDPKMIAKADADLKIKYKD